MGLSPHVGLLSTTKSAELHAEVENTQKGAEAPRPYSERMPNTCCRNPHNAHTRVDVAHIELGRIHRLYVIPPMVMGIARSNIGGHC